MLFRGWVCSWKGIRLCSLGMACRYVLSALSTGSISRLVRNMELIYIP